MNQKILFYNETEITNKNFKSMMFYKKFFYYRYITIIKLAMCFFIIGAVVILDFHRTDKVFCLFMSILGIIDTFRVKEIRENGRNVLKYEFFNECFQVQNHERLIIVSYKAVEKFIDTKEYYYMIIKGSIMLLAKNGFTLGKQEEIKDFLEERIEREKVVL